MHSQAAEDPDGGGFREIPRGSAQVVSVAGRRGIHALSLAELDALPDPKWLVQDLLPDRSLAVVFGAPSSGKTFTVLSLAAHVAAGADWCGRPVLQGVVFYIAAEGAGTLKRRVDALISALDEDSACVLTDHFFVIGRPVQLVDEEPLEELLQAMSRRSENPVLVVIDTLARCAVGLDENSAMEVGSFVQACDLIHQRTGAMVLVVHHCGKSDESPERGSSALRGAVDTMLRVKKCGNQITVKCEKQKDAEPSGDLVLRFEQVNLGVDASGNPVTSCRVVRELEGSAKTRHSVKRQPTTTDLILSALASSDSEAGLDAAILVERTSRSQSAVYGALKCLVSRNSIVNVGAEDRAKYRLAGIDDAPFQSHSDRNPPGTDETGPLIPDSIPAHPPKGGADWNEVRARIPGEVVSEPQPQGPVETADTSRVTALRQEDHDE